MSNMKKLIPAVAAALLTSTSAMADLTGTNMNMSVTHAGAFSGLSAVNNVTYTYGAPSTFTVPNWGSLLVTSPAPAPGLNNALKLDFTAFAYQSFGGPFATVGTVKLTNMAEPVDLTSVQLLVNGVNIALGPAVAAPNGFQASWNTQDVLNGNPINPNVTVAWNSVPAPGALALLGLAGLTSRPRRRRN
jgi:MYXO-CTERM domain-containing protein